MVVDLILVGGIAYTPEGLFRCGIAVDEGKIVGVAKESHLPQASRTIDARGKLLLPGVIDPHVHFRDPGYLYKEDYETGSKAAAAGGVTMVMDQPNTNPVPCTVQRFTEHRDNAKRKSVVDFNHFASPARITEVARIAEAGAIGFKIFQKKAAYPYNTEASISDYDSIFEAFKAVAKTMLPCSVHAHNTDVYDGIMRRFKERGELNWKSFFAVTSDEVVNVSTVPTLLYLASRASVRYYCLHCGLEDYVEMMREAKAAGKKVIAGVEYYSLVPPPKGKGDDVLKETDIPTTENHVSASWKGVLDGTLDFIESDHAPHTKEEIEIGLREPEKMALGQPGIDYYFSILLNEANRGRISIERLTQLCSSNVAKIFGIYPRKGALQIGSDADITIVDPKKTMTIRSEGLYTKVAWTPYEGYEVKGVPVYTIVRGSVVMEDSEVIGKPGYGDFVKPTLPVTSSS